MIQALVTERSTVGGVALGKQPFVKANVQLGGVCHDKAQAAIETGVAPLSARAKLWLPARQHKIITVLRVLPALSTLNSFEILVQCSQVLWYLKTLHLHIQHIHKV